MQVTVVVPQGKPLVGTSQVTVGFGSQLSFTVGVGMGGNTGLQSGLLTVMLPGQVIDGGVVSMTVTGKQHCARTTPLEFLSLQQTLVGP